MARLQTWPAATALAALLLAAPAHAGPVFHESVAVDDSAGGDGDGVLEPGESFRLTETVFHGTNALSCEFSPTPDCRPVGTRTSVTGTLGIPSSQGVTLTAPSAPYPDIPENAPASNATPFAGRYARTAACGRTLPFSVLLASDQASDTVSVPVPTGLTGAPVARESTDPPQAVPDNLPLGVESTLTITEPGFVKDVNVRIGSLTHTEVDDLEIHLIGPDGATIALSIMNGGDGDNFTGTTFDDEATALILPGGAPFSGSFRPSMFLSAFEGKPQQGTWTLRVRDVESGDAGTLNSWGLDIAPGACSVAPTAALSGAPNPAVAGQPVAFDGSGSSDLDGSIVRYEWDLDGDGGFETDTGASPSASRTYTEPGAVNAGLQVTDDQGNTATAASALTVAAPPAAPAAPGAPASPAADTAAPNVTLALGRSLRVRRGRVAVPVECSEDCGGVLTITTARAVQTSARRKLRIGRARFDLTAGGRRTLRVKLTKAGLRLVRRSALRVDVAVAARDSAGNQTTARRRSTLRRG